MKPRVSWTLFLLALAACHGGSSPTGPAPSSASPGMTFLGSSPPPGGAIVVADCHGGCTNRATFQFSVTIAEALPAPAALMVELLDASGQRCAYDFTASQALLVGRPVPFESNLLVLENGCRLPFSTSAVRATLIGDQTGRPHYVQGSFPLSYTFVEPPPASSTPTPPRILALDWKPGVDPGFCPLPGEGISVWCETIDDNGDAMTMTLQLTRLRPGPMASVSTLNRDFPPSTNAHELTSNWPMTTLADLRATCTATDAGGLTTSRSIDILCACGAGHCDPQ